MKSNPVLFSLPLEVDTSNVNRSPNHKWNLPYRTIFAVLTLDTIFIYDTFHLTPIAMARGLHYAGLTDCEWTNDGKHLLVTSSDGYISVLSFTEGELGIPYQKTENSMDENEKEQNNPHPLVNHEDFSKNTKLNSSQVEIPEIKMMQVKKKEKRKKKRIALTQVPSQENNAMNHKSENNLERIREIAQSSKKIDDNVVMEDVSQPKNNHGETEPMQKTMDNTTLYSMVSNSATKPAVSVKKMKKKRIQPIQLT